MDPSLFHIKWEQLFEVLVVIVVLSFFIERALSLLFESRFFFKHFSRKSCKEVIALIFSIAVCFIWKFDAISIILSENHNSWYGFLITGGVIAGGSKGSITLFRDLLGFMSDAEKIRQAEIERRLNSIKKEQK